MATILRMRSKGYDVLGPSGAGGEHHCAVGMMLVRFGHVGAARALVDAFPEFGSTLDCYGLDTKALLAAHEGPSAALPPSMRAFRTATTTASSSSSSSSSGSEEEQGVGGGAVAAPYGDGGWPTVEVGFPGLSDSDSCEVAELDGQAVARDPRAFVREFVLKRRPVILRDFVRHDKAGRAPPTHWRLVCMPTRLFLKSHLCACACFALPETGAPHCEDGAGRASVGAGPEHVGVGRHTLRRATRRL